MSDRATDQRADLTAILRAALDAIEPGRLVSRALVTRSAEVDPPNEWMIAVGKAAPAMAAAAAGLLGHRLRGGIVIGSTAWDPPPPLTMIVGGHPVPTVESARAGRTALAIAEHASDSDRLLVLLSGGASALMAVPADGVTLDDKRATTERLLKGGADIQALNTVRKHLSAVKGGRLAAATRASCRTLAISDVVGDDASVIGSGPSVADPSTFAQALSHIEACGLSEVPSAVVERFRQGMRGQHEETPKSNDPRLSRVEYVLVGGRANAMRGAAEAARQKGYEVIVIEDAVVGEARVAGPAHVQRALALARTAGTSVCVISSGETTVRVTGSGRGGRNMEFALASLEPLSRVASASMASVGTDGIDGPTDAAGAIVDGHTLTRAAGLGLEPNTFLANNDSFTFFRAVGDLIETGPTGTNVGDLQILLMAPR